jgi:spermidine/putrescine transport system substrate-binding protein
MPRISPFSPEAAAVLRVTGAAGPARGEGGGRDVGRRAFLGGAGSIGLAAVLAACNGGAPATGPSPAADRSGTDKVINWANWPLSLDFAVKTKTYPTLTKFEELFQIRATYDEAVTDDEAYFSSVQNRLRQGGDIGKDVVVLSDYMAATCISQGYIQRLDKSKIDNAEGISARLREPVFDPGRQYSLTWQSGFTGLAWRKDAVPGGLRHVSDLWHPRLKGKVEVLTEYRDTLGLIMLGAGADLAKFGDSDLDKSVETLQTQITSGQIRKVADSSYTDDLVSGEAVACMAWSGDIAQLNARNGNHWEFALPESGGTLWNHNLLVPMGSPHKENAEILMNYYFQSDIAAEVVAYTHYVCPVDGAQKAMNAIDPTLVDDPWIFPDEHQLAKGHVFRTLTAEEDQRYLAAFQQVIGA